MVIVSLFALALGCGESTAGSGQNREPEEVIVDAFNVALAGSLIPYEAERRPLIAEAIADHER